MQLFFTSILVVLSSACFAQECDPQALANQPGKWKAGLQGSVQGIRNSDYVVEKAILQKLQSMVSAGYKPQGVEVNYSYVFSKYGTNEWFGDPYHFSMYILPFLCDPNDPDKKKHYVAISSSTNVTIYVNRTYNGNIFAATLEKDDSRGYLRLEKMPVKKSGYWEFGEIIVGDRGSKSPTVLKEILVTSGDSLPFEPLSRKEYLLLTKNKLENLIKTDQGNNSYQKYMNKVTEALTLPDEELKKPAICYHSDEERFNGFLDEGAPGAVIAVKPNLSYFKKIVSLSTPQFFSIVYKYTKNNLVFENNVKAIEQSIDLTALKSMLGKNASIPKPTKQ